MSQLHLGTLITRPIQAHHEEGSPHGTFDMEVHCVEHTLNHSGDPKAFVMTTLAQHLASAVLDTEVPKEYWGFQPTQKLQTTFGWPELMAMGVGA